MSLAKCNFIQPLAGPPLPSELALPGFSAALGSSGRALRDAWLLPNHGGAQETNTSSPTARTE